MNVNLRNRHWLTFVFLVLSCWLNLVSGQCLSENVDLYYVNYEVSINRAVFNQAGEETSHYFKSIPNTTQVKSIAYALDHKELLFVTKESPNYVYGMSETIGIHTVVNQPNIKFDSIVVDSITGNIYYTENGRGIGSCSGHGLNSICTLLVDKSKDETRVVFNNLILYPKMGIMFWIQGDSSAGGPVQMASMNGEHVREIKGLEASYGLALDTENEELYISSSTRVKRFNLKTHSLEYFGTYSLKQILYLNCRLYSVEKGTNYGLDGAIKFTVAPFAHQYSYNYFSMSRRAEKFVSSLVSTVVQPVENPCKNLECNGFCVIGEGTSTLQPKCVCKNCVRASDVEDVTTRVETVKEAILLTVEHNTSNPTNSFLLLFTILFFLSLVGLGSAFLIYHFGLWAPIRARYAQTFGKQTYNSTANEPVIKLAGITDDL